MENEQVLDELLKRVEEMTDGEPIDSVRLGDSRAGQFYRHDERTRLALKVALITARPLLLVGPPGCGKSSLAPYVARNLGLHYEFYTVTENAEASDLLWQIDYLRRLNDAQLKDKQVEPLEEYVQKGTLWKAFEPAHQPGEKHGTLVLIDEIDKADASFANSLLVALGSLEFDCPPLERPVKAREGEFIVVMMTSNEERELPPALTRRCITHRVKYPKSKHLVEIVERQWPMWIDQPGFRESVGSLADSLAGEEAAERDSRISTAEFLDLVQVLRKGDVKPHNEEWKTIESLVLLQSNEEES